MGISAFIETLVKAFAASSEDIFGSHIDGIGLGGVTGQLVFVEDG